MDHSDYRRVRRIQRGAGVSKVGAFAFLVLLSVGYFATLFLMQLSVSISILGFLLLTGVYAYFLCHGFYQLHCIYLAKKCRHVSKKSDQMCCTLALSYLFLFYFITQKNAEDTNTEKRQSDRPAEFKRRQVEGGTGQGKEKYENRQRHAFEVGKKYPTGRGGVLDHEAGAHTDEKRFKLKVQMKVHIHGPAQPE